MKHIQQLFSLTYLIPNIFLLISFILLNTSCDNNDADIIIMEEEIIEDIYSKNIKTELSLNNNGLITYEYDDERRLIRENHPNNKYYTYEYLDSKIIKTRHTDSSTEDTVYFLNSKGFVSRLESTRIEKFTYDEDGHLIKIEIPIFNGVVTRDFIYNEKGNLVKLIVDNSPSDPTIHTYTYYEQEDNILSNNTKGLYFLGKPSTNLLKSDEVRPFGYSPFRNDFEYEKDGNNRIIKKYQITPSGTVCTEFTY